MEIFKEYLEFILLAVAGLGSWFNLKNKVQTQTDKLTATRKEVDKVTSDLEAVAERSREAIEVNARAIRELEMQHVSTIENREMVNRMLEKQDTRMEKMD